MTVERIEIEATRGGYIAIVEVVDRLLGARRTTLRAETRREIFQAVMGWVGEPSPIPASPTPSLDGVPYDVLMAEIRRRRAANAR